MRHLNWFGYLMVLVATFAAGSLWGIYGAILVVAAAAFVISVVSAAVSAISRPLAKLLYELAGEMESKPHAKKERRFRTGSASVEDAEIVE